MQELMTHLDNDTYLFFKHVDFKIGDGYIEDCLFIEKHFNKSLKESEYIVKIKMLTKAYQRMVELGEKIRTDSTVLDESVIIEMLQPFIKQEISIKRFF
jgi:hypothetical protein